ncbi:MAG TPA: hypothetical protein VFS36_02030 [Chitinophagaceae bacterium]|nr:hypothetical protein [Chitinophagaceae bacterium]
MKAKTITPMGALHPVLFFACVYVVALLLSIFICSSIFYSLNGTASDDAALVKKQEQPVAAQPTLSAYSSSMASLH